MQGYGCTYHPSARSAVSEFGQPRGTHCVRLGLDPEYVLLQLSRGVQPGRVQQKLDLGIIELVQSLVQLLPSIVGRCLAADSVDRTVVRRRTHSWRGRAGVGCVNPNILRLGLLYCL